MANSLLKKLRGFQKAPRNRFLLLFDMGITSEEFSVYELGIAVTDWDSDHIETYETFYATNTELAEILHKKSDTTIGRIKKSLIKKGLFEKVGKRIKVYDFDKWQLRKNYPAKIQSYPAKITKPVANLQEEPAKMQTISPQKPVYSLGSYKGNVSVIRTEEEYQRIWKENFDSSPGFTPDDMKWIDLNVFENANVPS